MSKGDAQNSWAIIGLVIIVGIVALISMLSFSNTDLSGEILRERSPQAPNLQGNAAEVPDSCSADRVAIREEGDEQEFYIPSTGELFIPQGVHYGEKNDVFNVGMYKRFHVGKDLEAIAQRGYNVVTVIVDFRESARYNTYGQAVPAWEYVNNMVDFLQRAKTHNLRVILRFPEYLSPVYSTVPLPQEDIQDFSNLNRVMLSETRVQHPIS